MIAIDLFCGLGGWADGFLAEGYRVIGFDIEKHDYGTGTYPGELVIQDVMTLHGKQFKDATVIVASPPCQAYSYRAMPWSRAKALPPPDNTLFEACFRIQREACEASGRHIPLIVENVRGAQRWVGRAQWHFGSYYLWGDVPALMPIDRSWKTQGQNWNAFKQTGKVSAHWRLQGIKPPSTRLWHDGVKVGGAGPRMWRDRVSARLNDERRNFYHQRCGTKTGGDWFSDPTHHCRRTWSTSKARKAASAEIAKIPYPLALHIARTFKVSATQPPNQ